MGLRALWFGDGTQCAIGLRGGACVHAASSIATHITASRQRFDCTIAHHAKFEGSHSACIECVRPCSASEKPGQSGLSDFSTPHPRRTCACPSNGLEKSTLSPVLRL